MGKAYSISNRSIVDITILAPEAKTFDEYAQTAMKAAKEQLEKQGVDVIYVYLAPDASLVGIGPYYARVHYALDGKGLSGEQDWTWEVYATHEIYTETEIKVTYLWEQYKERYRVDEFVFNEEALIKAIANELSINEEDVMPLYSNLMVYNVNS